MPRSSPGCRPVYRPVVRYPRFYGLEGRDLGLELPLRVHASSARPRAFAKRFFTYLKSMGTPGPMTRYQEDYNDQTNNVAGGDGPGALHRRSDRRAVARIRTTRRSGARSAGTPSTSSTGTAARTSSSTSTPRRTNRIRTRAYNFGRDRGVPKDGLVGRDPQPELVLRLLGRARRPGPATSTSTTLDLDGETERRTTASRPSGSTAPAAYREPGDLSQRHGR